MERFWWILVNSQVEILADRSAARLVGVIPTAYWTLWPYILWFHSNIRLQIFRDLCRHTPWSWLSATEAAACDLR